MACGTLSGGWQTTSKAAALTAMPSGWNRPPAYAATHGYDSFTTTLLVSPYQKHELIRQIGERLAEQYGIQFLYRDFRVGFREGQEKAREAGLYMQKYCGCIFSEEDRYIRNRPLKKPPVQINPKPVNPKKLARMEKAAANAAARAEHERLAAAAAGEEPGK